MNSFHIVLMSSVSLQLHSYHGEFDYKIQRLSDAVCLPYHVKCFFLKKHYLCNLPATAQNTVGKQR